MTPPHQPHLIQINMTDKYGRSSDFHVPVHVLNLDECSVPENRWTTDPAKLKDPTLQFFHVSCKPNCQQLCDPRTPWCAVCIDTPGSYRCECVAPDFRFNGTHCIDNKPPIPRIDPTPYNETICFDCSEFFRETDANLPVLCVDTLSLIHI
eukprot:TRINITY_DN6746_c0_g1_i1.p1 TRINITY_DN6746_c0_g1~~TRINITY_DN6746_c0_g1_i1.p1  ORF type:complete len:171 (+),score=25.77 TRINITY_DN6746_c0_g1_i1:61-513(+)